MLPLKVKSSSDLIFAFDPISHTFIKLSLSFETPVGYINYFESYLNDYIMSEFVDFSLRLVALRRYQSMSYVM